MTASNALMVRLLPDALKVIALEPPGWTRLEPQSRSGDPAPGLEARVHDPLWLLARQWQFGEFRGEDAGTPLAVHIEIASARVTAWQAGPPTSQTPGPVRTWNADDPIDPVVEREPPPADGVGLRQRAEAGALLVARLAEKGVDARATLLAQCPLFDSDDQAKEAPRLYRTLALACPDGEKAAALIESGPAGVALIAGTNREAAEAARTWPLWYRGSVSPKRADVTDAWNPQRLEHQFSLRIGSGATQRVLTAPSHDDDGIDWHAFDHQVGAHLDIAGEQAGAADQPPKLDVIAAPLRYAGMPADRIWQFEDGAVNFGALEVQPHDLARLCFSEFALIYGNDWFVAPVDVDYGSLTQVTRLTYRTTFGEERQVAAADDTRRSGRFRLFELAIAGQTDATLPGLFVPPSAQMPVAGRALEDVLLLRDESVHMAWAIEKTVQDVSGDPRNRSDERRTDPPSHDMLAGADLRYTLETTVPRNWIPLVPVAKPGGSQGFVLQKGTMTDEDEVRGQLLTREKPFFLQEEEVPREGVRVTRVPHLARTVDGKRLRWVARRVSVGRGEGSSGLAFDSATR
jgi:hypothetical protein